VYRTDKVSIAPTSWRDLLEPKPELRGHIGWIADYVETFIPMLKLQGSSVYSAERSDLKRAYQQLKRLNPDLVSYDYVLSEVVDDIESPIHMALATVVITTPSMMSRGRITGVLLRRRRDPQYGSIALPLWQIPNSETKPCCS